MSSRVLSGRDTENPAVLKERAVRSFVSSRISTSHTTDRRQQSAPLIVVKLGDLSTCPQQPLLSRAPGQQTGAFCFCPRPPLPRVPLGKDKGALGWTKRSVVGGRKQREKETRENKAPRGISSNYTTTEGM